MFSKLSKTTLLAVTTILFLLEVPHASAATYDIDDSHTKVGFSIRHLGISNVHGKFTNFEGTFSFDKNNIADSSVKAVITTNSIDTENKKRDDHLRSPDFFAVEKNPSITFTSKEIKDIKDNSFTIVGDLQIAGVTKEVELATTFEGQVTDPWGKERAGFSATTKIDRTDFGLTWSKLLETGGLVVGEDVKITLEVEGIKKK